MQQLTQYTPVFPGRGDLWGSPKDAPTWECQACLKEHSEPVKRCECGSDDIRRIK